MSAKGESTGATAAYYGALGQDFERANGYSWDLVIVREHPTPEGKVAPETIIKKLTRRTSRPTRTCRCRATRCTSRSARTSSG